VVEEAGHILLLALSDGQAPPVAPSCTGWSNLCNMIKNTSWAPSCRGCRGGAGGPGGSLRGWAAGLPSHVRVCAAWRDAFTHVPAGRYTYLKLGARPHHCGGRLLLFPLMMLQLPLLMVTLCGCWYEKYNLANRQAAPVAAAS